MRFFLIDKIKELVPGKFARGVKCWSLDNPIFQDHFPGFPVVPGIMLTESMAQLSGRLLEESYYKQYPHASKVYPVLSIIQKAKFKTFVQPGDQCVVEAEIISIDNNRGNVEVKTLVEDLRKRDAKHHATLIEVEDKQKRMQDEMRKDSENFEKQLKIIQVNMLNSSPSQA